MTIYVDRYLDELVTDKWHGGGHLFGTEIVELHRFALAMGLRRSSFDGSVTYPHYDLVHTMRALALEKGAVAIDTSAGVLPNDILVRRSDGHYEPRWKRLRRRTAMNLANPDPGEQQRP